MTDLSKEALDALVADLRRLGGHGFPNWADDAADEITALRAENEALAAREAAAHREGKLEGLREAMAEVKSWFKDNEFDPFSVHLVALAERIEKGVE